MVKETNNEIRSCWNRCIGSGWITRMLAHGHEVIATDPSEGAYERMLTQVKQNWPYAEQMGLAENASIQNLTFTPHLEEAVKDADHIQENVPEVEEIKDAVLKEIDFMRNLKQQLVQVHQELCLQNYKLTYHILND